MKIEDEACVARGFVSPSFIDVSTGEKREFFTRKNTLSYMSAEAMAAAFGGDPSYIPSRIGFIYGDGDSMPGLTSITRDQSWEGIMEGLDEDGARTHMDIQIVGFSYHPTLGSCPTSGDSSSPDDDDGDYCHILPTGSNAITFHAVSNSNGTGFIGNPAFKSGSGNWNKLYQAILLGLHEGSYYVLSRVSLKDGDVYRSKPEGFEVAIDWTIAFR